MKITSIVVSIVVLLSLSITVYAKEVGQGVGSANQQVQQEDSANEIENEIQNQNEIETQNQGEENQLQVNTEEQETSGEDTGEPRGMPKDESPRSEVALENMSVVAQKVEELLMARLTQEGIGEQVRQVAQDQVQAQVQTEFELKKVDNRKGLLKSILGPDYSSIKNMKKIMEENQLRIQQMEQLQTQLENQEEVILVQQTVQALVDQNTALQDRVALEEQSGSLLGWLVRLLAR